MTQVNYVLDANVFMEAAGHYYAFDLVPKFWDCLNEHSRTGRVRSIDRVMDELERGNDELAEWASESFVHAFATTDDARVIAAFREVMGWVQSQAQFTDPAKTQFAACPDGWLVAYARVHGCTVVTHETFSPDAKNRVKIPNVCQAFNVPYLDTFAMLRGLGAKLG